MVFSVYRIFQLVFLVLGLEKLSFLVNVCVHATLRYIPERLITFEGTKHWLLNIGSKSRDVIVPKPFDLGGFNKAQPIVFLFLWNIAEHIAVNLLNFSGRMHLPYPPDRKSLSDFFDRKKTA